MIRKDIKNTLIYKELQLNSDSYFSYKDKKFIHNIDTFYYSVFIKDDVLDLSKFKCLEQLISDLAIKKQNVIDSSSDIYYLEEDELLVTRKRFKIYEYCLSVNNMFDIFISSYLPNESTPRIVVQLRSIGLWLHGEKEIVNRSFSIVEKILRQYGIEVLKVQENRIDYAYHTNYIQNPLIYFDDDTIKNKLDTTFTIYQKVGRKNNRELTIEYLSLGQRSSNNLFFRIYNKTREVVEMNYKGFFIELWYKEGLISFYDKFVLEYAYKKGRYDSLEWGKLEFYLKYGQDINIKKQIELLKKDYKTNLDHVRQFTKNILPNVTLVMNIEFQTMRKFYYYSDEFINNTLETSEENIKLKRLFKIIDNRKVFLDYLTLHTIRFRKNEIQTSDWWYRLSNLKLQSNTCKELIRDYSRNLDIEKIKTKIKGNVASLNMYLLREESSLNEDMSALLCCLNDNEIEHLRFVNPDTGEVVEMIDNDYLFIKEKKKKSLKSLLK